MQTNQKLLGEAIMSDDVNRISELLTKDDVNINESTLHEFTATILAIKAKKLNVIKLLLENGADLSLFNHGALRTAVSLNDKDIVKLLPDAKDKEMEMRKILTPAIMSGDSMAIKPDSREDFMNRKNIVQLMISYGATPWEDGKNDAVFQNFKHRFNDLLPLSTITEIVKECDYTAPFSNQLQKNIIAIFELCKNNDIGVEKYRENIGAIIRFCENDNIIIGGGERDEINTKEWITCSNKELLQLTNPRHSHYSTIPTVDKVQQDFVIAIKNGRITPATQSNETDVTNLNSNLKTK